MVTLNDNIVRIGIYLLQHIECSMFVIFLTLHRVLSFCVTQDCLIISHMPDCAYDLIISIYCTRTVY